jgi:uncharacterized protein YbjT (DUF2867 family)
VKVLVTGATGFTGRRVVRELLDAGHRVTCFVRGTSDRSVVPASDCRFETGDLADEASLARAIAGHDALVNVASIGFGHGPGIVRALAAAGVRRALFFSTTAIFTRLPASSRRVRVEAEDAIRDGGLRWTILRPTMIYGAPGDRNVERLLGALSRWPALPVPAGKGRRIQPVLVDDLAKATVRALAAEATVGRAYSLSGRAPVTFGEFVRAAARALGRRVLFVPVPPVAAKAAAGFLERCLPRPRIRAEQVERLLEDKDFDWAAAGRDFGYDPVGVEEGLALAVRRRREGT